LPIIASNRELEADERSILLLHLATSTLDGVNIAQIKPRLNSRVFLDTRIHIRASAHKTPADSGEHRPASCSVSRRENAILIGITGLMADSKLVFDSLRDARIARARFIEDTFASNVPGGCWTNCIRAISLSCSMVGGHASFSGDAY
jgi:hypothetical protein